MKSSDSISLWAKVGNITEICLMAKNVVLFGKGCFIQFINISTGEEHHLMVNNHKINGDGVKCLRGHDFLHIFAYAEKCQAPNLYVKSYPDFQLIAKFTGGPKEGYKCLAFSETSLLFSLGEMPHYTVTAWNWRSLEKFAESYNELLYEDQIIRCSFGRPMYLAQLGIGSTKLFIWDVFTVCKTSIFSNHEVKLGNLNPAPFMNVTWTHDGQGFFIIDRKGCIYTVDRDFYLEIVIDGSFEGNIPPSLCWYHHGVAVSGPDEVIRHYKRVGTTWTCDWSYATERKLQKLLCNKTEKFIALTETYEIVALSSNPENQQFIRKNQSNFLDICIINPAGEFIVALCNENILNVYNINTGDLVSTLTLKYNVLSLAENPELPCVAIGHNEGIIELISVYNEQKLSVMVALHLTDIPLTNTSFYEHGNIFITGNINLGEFFILKGLPGTQIEVVVHLELHRQIADFFLVASQNMIRFFVLNITSNKYYAGNKITRYCIVDSQIVNIKEYQFEDDSVLYRRMLPKKGSDRDKIFYVVPFNARHIQVAQSQRGLAIITVKETIKTGHQIKRLFAHLTHYNALTWSYDGFIFLRSTDFQQVLGITLPHHRYLQGVKRASVNPTGKIIVSLGTEGVIAAMELTDVIEDENRKIHLMDQKNSTKMALMFKRPTLGLTVESKYEGKCWKEMQRLKNIEKEEEICKIEKTKILKEFEEIQTILQELVTQNLEGPENKNIDLLEFYLDTTLYNKKQQQNKEECKKLEIYLKCLIIAQDKVSEFIVKNYWEPMGVSWQQILGIFSAVKATNYCLLPEDDNKLKRLQWIEEQRKVEQFLSSQDTFEPWVSVPKEKLLENIAKRPALPREDYSGVAALRRLQEIEELDSNKSLETKIALAGAVSQILISCSPGHYQQRQLTSFYQCELQQAVAEREVIKLKQSYNRCFTNMMAVKEREVYNIKEKNAKLRHIASEYNYFSDKKVCIDVVDPEWAETEHPVTVTRVIDEEIAIRPYVSPSEQAILDAKAAEEERIRLLLLADDFRERALMTMMNGVLEVRWEDELKKDVPKPKCLIEKEIEEYNEEDLRAIRDYDEKVIALYIEREKYKTLLEVEFTKLSTNLRESIRKFNQKLYECTKYKFYIDSGMNQENLQVNRARLTQNQRIEIDQREIEIINTVKIFEKEAEENLKKVTFMQEALVECRTTLELMQAKEKNLEKAYRKDFQDASPVVQEQAYKLYKKRPKATFRNITTATVLNELAKGILTNETTFAMTQECLDYLKALEQLDLFMGLPPTIEESTWALICKHRRIRIEFDIRFRAAQIQILDGEATIATFQKRITTKKEKIAKLSAELEQSRAKRLYLMHNKQVQVVLRRGLVEIPLSGDLFTDFKDAILVPKVEIEHVNKLILDAGNLKLKTILQNMKFRRNVMATEWEHMQIRMQINDLIEQKRDIENVKFTKDMQVYLKNKSLGRKLEAESFELEIELLAAAYENRIKDKKDKFRKIRKQQRAYCENNKVLDKTIQEVNIDVCHFKLQKDFEVEVKEKEVLHARMSAMLRRNQLVKQVQQNHNEILVLQTELELLRLRTFPTFKYKVLDNE